MSETTPSVHNADFKLPFVLFRKEDLAVQIGIPLEILEMTHRQITTAGQMEKMVRVTEKKKKSGNGTRKTHDLEPNLKSINRGIDKMLKQVKLPDCFKGGVKKGTIKANATIHLGNPHMEVMDISNFFPSIGARRIKKMFVKIGCSGEIARFITPFVTYKGIDPQGFPTAGTIANIYLANSCYLPIKSILGEKIADSYWVDDIAFSSKQKISHEKIGKVIGILKSVGLTVHPKKTKSLGKNAIKELTGTEIGETVKPHRVKVISLETDLHLLRKHTPSHIALTRYEKNEKRLKSKSSPEKWLIEHVGGLLSHVKGINEKSFSRIVVKYADVVSKFDILKNSPKKI